MAIIVIQGAAEKAAGIRYEVDTTLPPLGQGGMGQVMRGVRIDERTGIRTDVAIKFLYDDLPDNAIERARREASIQIHNENLVEMFGFIQIDAPGANGALQPHYHVASELLNGVMLYDLLQGRTTDTLGNEIPFAQELYRQYNDDRMRFVVTIAKSLLSGLMALHDAGYIHRDIDPSNIMVTSNGKIKLIDFGIAKKLETAAGPKQHLTSAGQFMGKAAYAAPELVLGDINHENETTDLYAVGIMLYELAVGKLPFEGTIQEVASAQLNQKVPIADIQNKPLQRIVGKATAKKQSERYQSASEFRVAMEQLSRNSTAGGGTGGSKSDISLSLPKMPKLPTMPKLSKKVWMSIAGAVAVIAIVAIVAIAVTPSEAERQAKAERLAQEQAQAEADSIAMVNRIAALANEIADSSADTEIIDSLTQTPIKTAGKVYNEALSLLLDPATATEGIEKLELIADKRYKSSVPAMFMLSSIYSRNKLLDPMILQSTASLYTEPDYKYANEINRQILEIDPTYYPAIYELALDYASSKRGIVSSADFDKALEQFEIGVKYAEEANDSIYLPKFLGSIEQLK